ncbi:hypothetical protein HK101_001443 [Irineochytrium annulatum]|nr:hypothetical protein HK101_001443 [Irineochytrium annulatum]
MSAVIAATLFFFGGYGRRATTIHEMAKSSIALTLDDLVVVGSDRPDPKSLQGGKIVDSSSDKNININPLNPHNVASPEPIAAASPSPKKPAFGAENGAAADKAIAKLTEFEFEEEEVDDDVDGFKKEEKVMKAFKEDKKKEEKKKDEKKDAKKDWTKKGDEKEKEKEPDEKKDGKKSDEKKWDPKKVDDKKSHDSKKTEKKKAGDKKASDDEKKQALIEEEIEDSPKTYKQELSALAAKIAAEKTKQEAKEKDTVRIEKEKVKSLEKEKALEKEKDEMEKEKEQEMLKQKPVGGMTPDLDETALSPSKNSAGKIDSEHNSGGASKDGMLKLDTEAAAKNKDGSKGGKTDGSKEASKDSGKQSSKESGKESSKNKDSAKDGKDGGKKSYDSPPPKDPLPPAAEVADTHKDNPTHRGVANHEDEQLHQHAASPQKKGTVEDHRIESSPLDLDDPRLLSELDAKTKKKASSSDAGGDAKGDDGSKPPSSHPKPADPHDEDEDYRDGSHPPSQYASGSQVHGDPSGPARNVEGANTPHGSSSGSSSSGSLQGAHGGIAAAAALDAVKKKEAGFGADGDYGMSEVAASMAAAKEAAKEAAGDGLADGESGHTEEDATGASELGAVAAAVAAASPSSGGVKKEAKKQETEEYRELVAESNSAAAALVEQTEEGPSVGKALKAAQEEYDYQDAKTGSKVGTYVDVEGSSLGEPEVIDR